MNDNVSKRIDWLCQAVSKAIEASWTLSIPVPKLMVENEGRKYVKLAIYHLKGDAYKAESVYCFIDKTNGDLLKGTWLAPVANGKRGNIFDADILTKLNQYGIQYLRGPAFPSIEEILKEHKVSV